MSRGTRAVIDLRALQHNFQRVRQCARFSRVLAVVKADGYGSGAVPVAQALPDADGFGVATFAEAVALRHAGIQQPILLLEGVLNAKELQQAAEQRFDVVVHQEWQLDLLLNTPIAAALVVWLKVNTGMNRLGLPPERLPAVCEALRGSSAVSELRLMSHLACADELGHPLNQRQSDKFAELVSQTGLQQASFANSAGIMRGEAFHYQWVRPGLMLYGAAPLLESSAAELDLKPVMQLESSVIAKSVVASGDTVGYGATWTAQKETPVAVVAIGYGDGYPRHVSSEAFVLIEGQRCPLIGRVSMDMITVDISAVPQVPVTTPVILWGNGLPVEWVARWAGTVNYELLCQVTDRVQRVYLGH